MRLSNYEKNGDGDGDCEMIRFSEVHKPCLHNVQIGRPDVDALMRAAAASLQAREGIRADLVVAACGPKTLVEETKKAVMTVKGVADYMHVNVRFSTVDWYS